MAASGESEPGPTDGSLGRRGSQADIDIDAQAALDRLVELDRLKASFLSTISHELRTTVTVIEGFAMLLSRQRQHLDDATQADFVDRIWRSARSLGTLVEDLLDLADVDDPTKRVDRHTVPLTELVGKILDQSEALLAGQVLVREIEPAVVGDVDPWAIERVLVNLLANAAKFTPAGTRVTVGLRNEDTGAVVLSVADTGPGIPPVERERVFERFYRIEPSGVGLTRGMGVGLALVRDLIGRHEGTVTLDETPGGGATFVVTVPLRPTTTPGAA